MNETILDSDHSQNGINVTSTAQAGLKTAASWSTFLAILGFIFAGLMALASVGSLFLVGQFSQLGIPFPVWIIPLFYIGMTALMIITLLFLYRFASKTKTALAAGSSAELEGALVNLGKYFKIVGIMTIAVLILYVILLSSFGSLMSMFNPTDFNPSDFGTE